MQKKAITPHKKQVTPPNRATHPPKLTQAAMKREVNDLFRRYKKVFESLAHK